MIFAEVFLRKSIDLTLELISEQVAQLLHMQYGENFSVADFSFYYVLIIAMPIMIRSAAVLVLGDIGRSPRMCNHALSLAKFPMKVDIVGYNGI